MTPYPDNTGYGTQQTCSDEGPPSSRLLRVIALVVFTSGASIVPGPVLWALVQGDDFVDGGWLEFAHHQRTIGREPLVGRAAC